MQAHILREKFLEFFKSKKHKILESDSLVPAGDPTVLFTPAGMNQFKKEFLGFDSGFKRAATSQRCLRTDDLDKVGKTSGHHTFFEMLGNFSFGDYFKEEAILWAWSFLTKELKINQKNLWISVYKDDAETYKIWRDLIKVPAAKVIKLGDKENFWPSEAKATGPNGPCGPCSEIFFDQGSNTGCRRPDCTPACGCGRFVEVWNLVFTQFNRKEGGILESLPRKNIDTGMGLERLAAVMQGVSNNFQTDLFKPLVNEIICEVKNDNPENRESVYAVADHIRAIAFAIYDGVLPSNEARGYVVRKIIRKSTLHLKGMGLKQPFLYKLVPALAQVMKPYYPELMQRRENIAEVILAEEKSFISTLNSSGALLKEKFQEFSEKQNPEEAGRIAFQLYDTYGIPLELATDWLDKHGIRISKEAFNQELAEQKSRSKSQSAMKGDVFDIKGLGLGVKETNFLGYKDYQSLSKILKIIRDGAEIKKADAKDTVEIILDKTPFYPESGGQIGDSGEFIKGRSVFEVLDTAKTGKAILHIGKVKTGSFKKGDSVSARINSARRLSIARNHTATHLLQAALRKVMGPHVQQQGSLVGEDKFRFDFTHFKDIDKAQLDRIEEIVNGYIIDDYPLRVKQMTLSEAKKTGALAFFGEKYEGKVRVVSVDDISSELCAGTHLDSTGQIGIFKIIQEGTVASGVRRIEAATGTFAYKIIKEEERAIDDISSLLGVPADRINVELAKRLSKIKELEKQLNSQKFNSIQASLDDLDKNAEVINGIKVITYVTRDLDMDTLRKTVDLIKEKVNNANAFIAAGTVNAGDNVMLVFGATADLCSKGVDAGNLIKQVAPEIGGSGGGRKDFAQAGGNKPENFAKAFQKLRELIENLP
jgi:alanyl-tRNA synthetase